MCALTLPLIYICGVEGLVIVNKVAQIISSYSHMSVLFIYVIVAENNKSKWTK